MVTPVYVVYYVCAVLVIITTVFGNLLVIISVCHFRQLHTPTNVLLLSLAVADLLVGLFVMPLEFTWLIESCWVFDVSVFAFLFFFSFQLTCASVHNVVLIAVDRYLALSNPFMYTKQITVKLSVIVALLNWLFASSYNFTLLYCNGFFTHALTLCPSELPIFMNEVWSWVDFVIVFALPCSMMFVLYLKIFAIARKHAIAIRAANAQGNPNNRQAHNVPKRSERKAAKVLGILVCVFLCCVVPYYAASLLAEFVSGDIFDYVLNGTSVMLYLNSLLNPIIYALFYPWFQKSMKLILRCHICTPESSLVQLK
ncbi:trace amine-associated receptor 13c-like [Engraulis encrasicolus]|uniref:trace amine-associated receptor 13c-like n=1 Tax=Engraulis encrasicolus TaxID=184585 RepID=UPI002FD44EF3